jgi:TPR repeat protein
LIASFAQAGGLEDGISAVSRNDYVLALKKFRSAAEEGNPIAQNNLGLLYHNGQGVTQDYKEALKWYSLAAEQGHMLAQSSVGMAYHNGLGVTQDYREAVKW